ncbi:hypothetical protein MYX84_09970 [Acidobacteria bacterium AH-259-O06]|nr:hypothetical protein [Acidobacteria bacterium AH-259-O06]
MSRVNSCQIRVKSVGQEICIFARYFWAANGTICYLFMGNSLDPQRVRQWLQGHGKAQRIIQEERQTYLSQLDAAEALQFYTELLSCAGHADLRRPSVLLMAMRKAARHKQDSTSA